MRDILLWIGITLNGIGVFFNTKSIDIHTKQLKELNARR
jgi:hypothetical protein